MYFIIYSYIFCSFIVFGNAVSQVIIILLGLFNCFYFKLYFISVICRNILHTRNIWTFKSNFNRFLYQMNNNATGSCISYQTFNLNATMQFDRQFLSWIIVQDCVTSELPGPVLGCSYGGQEVAVGDVARNGTECVLEAPERANFLLCRSGSWRRLSSNCL